LRQLLDFILELKVDSCGSDPATVTAAAARLGYKERIHIPFQYLDNSNNFQ
jgi:hypothetical protein